MEIWKPVLGFEKSYLVSNKGGVKSIERKIEQKSRWGGTYIKSLPAVELRPYKMDSGHLMVCLGRGNNRLVHHLVLEAFYGQRPEGLECLHKNGIPWDNELENLSWGTRSRNLMDNKWQGKHKKLTPEQVRQIKKLIKNKFSGAEIARKFNISQSTISDIKSLRTHKDVE